MNKKMHIHWDAEGEYIEVRFGEPRPSYFEDKGDDMFERIDEKTGDVTGYAIFNVQKRQLAKPKDITVNIPEMVA